MQSHRMQTSFMVVGIALHRGTHFIVFGCNRSAHGRSVEYTYYICMIPENNPNQSGYSPHCKCPICLNSLILSIWSIWLSLSIWSSWPVWFIWSNLPIWFNKPIWSNSLIGLFEPPGAKHPAPSTQHPAPALSTPKSAAHLTTSSTRIL